MTANEVAELDTPLALAPRPAVARLMLTDFRSYAGARLEVAPTPVVLSGPNGAGKTNLLEAISLLAPGRGLRRASFEEVAALGSGGAWAVAATIESPEGPVDIGTGGAIEEGPRRVRINGANAKTVEEMSAYLR